MRFKDELYNNVRFADRDIDLVWNVDGTRLNKINPFPLTYLDFSFDISNNLSLKKFFKDCFL